METKDNTLRATMMRQHIESCKSGSLTVAAYCKEHDLAPSNYYYWQKRLMRPAVKGGFVELCPSAVRDTVSIRFPNGVQITFSGSVATTVLKELVCSI